MFSGKWGLSNSSGFGSVVVLGLTVAVSYSMVRHSFAVVGQSESKFLYDFVAEFSQNLYFVGTGPHLLALGGRSRSYTRLARS